jgi:DNA mismatch repair protein MutS2
VSYYEEQSAKDLEFNHIKDLLIGYSVGETAAAKFEKLRPYPNYEKAVEELNLCDELFQIKVYLSGFPRLEFKELNKEISILNAAGSVLNLEGITALLDASYLVNEIIQFLKKTDRKYPHLEQILKDVYYTKDIISPIEKVLDRNRKVKDDASPTLKKIRLDIQSTKRQINKNFEKVLRALQSKGYVAEYEESFLNERRVLSIVSKYKRSVGGTILGSSKTGSVTYIEPEINGQLNHELDMLLDDEKKEIKRIFMELTKELSQHLFLVKAYQYVLTRFDFIQAKVKLAQLYDGKKPYLVKDTIIHLKKAYHPILFLKNKLENKTTFPQSLKLDNNGRMLIISGPNAGGKSITLKTVGLLQMMVQSGLMIPAEEDSTLGWFTHILTDIGDNQSIENQLSTYSYRLKRMKLFLDKASTKSLFLLDEFGTGSDPDLGGALAEVFFETLYDKNSFAVITTHYSNIKLKASSLENAINANMLFDKETLQPLYRLSIGQPGSSFTFEVAKINGIPDHLIERAKKKLKSRQVEMDQLIATLQTEKVKYEDLIKKLETDLKSANQAKEKYDKSQNLIEEKNEKLQQLLSENDANIQKGKKLAKYIERFDNKNIKPLLEEIKKYLTIEKSKIDDAQKKAAIIQKMKEEKKQVKQKKNQKSRFKERPVFVGALVRLKESNQKGKVSEINGEEATVIIGNFKVKTNISKLFVV